MDGQSVDDERPRERVPQQALGHRTRQAGVGVVDADSVTTSRTADCDSCSSASVTAPSTSRPSTTTSGATAAAKATTSARAR
ncbi:MAG: hypothetical protein QOH97_1040 [Actinoplanes sp.]|jgi:hypothetical protein|nr:hypothetical protein [Actinoplanes sp.]